MNCTSRRILLAGPTTYRQIEWAAHTCRQQKEGQHQAAAYRQVYTGEFRASLLNGASESTVKRLLDYLNQMNADLPADTLLPVLLTSVPDAVASLRHLVSATLYDVEGDGLSDWDSALSTRAADRLMADDGVDFALASQILSIVNPALFLPWDLATHHHFFPKNDPYDGFAAVRYSRFIWKMADHPPEPSAKLTTPQLPTIARLQRPGRIEIVLCRKHWVSALPTPLPNSSTTTYG